MRFTSAGVHVKPVQGLGTFSPNAAASRQPESDSPRRHCPGSNWRRKVERLGAKPAVDLGGLLTVRPDYTGVRIDADRKRAGKHRQVRTCPGALKS